MNPTTEGINERFWVDLEGNLLLFKMKFQQNIEAKPLICEVFPQNTVFLLFFVLHLKDYLFKKLASH
jgi:hypothetical protein